MGHWVTDKHFMPNIGQEVLIKLKYKEPFFCCARYFPNYSCLQGDFENIFLVEVHPRFPKEWLLSEKYTKISVIHKSKVEKWMAIEV
jgi:hypothetical protein